MIKAVVFDFDGLIIDTETPWYEAYCEVLKKFEVELPLSEYATYIGTEGDSFRLYLEEKIGGKITKEEIHRRVRNIHVEKLQGVMIREGVLDYLEAAKEMNLRIALATSSSRDWITQFLHKLNISDYFEVLQTKDDVERVKPNPALYQNVIKELGILPEEAVAFEDSANGAKAATTAGLYCIIVPNSVTAKLNFEKYHLRLTTMQEKTLKEIIATI